MPGLGHNSYVAAAKEAVWGTKVVAGMTLVEHMSETLQAQYSEKVVQGIAMSRTRTKRVRGAKTVGGDLVWEVTPEDVIGLMLKSLLPTENFTDDGPGNGGVHVFTPGSALPAGLTLQVFRSSQGDGSAIAGNTRDYFGGRITQLQLEAAADELLKATAGLTFKDEDAGTFQDPTGNYDAQPPLVYHTGTFEIDGVSVPVSSFAVTIASGMKTERRRLGSDLILQQQPGMYDITGQFAAYYDDMTLVNRFYANTPAKLVLDMTGALIGTTLRRLKIEIPVGYLNGETPKVSGADAETMLTLPFRAIKTGTGSPDQAVQITLANSYQLAY
jgi:hypothetical protein